MTLDSDIIEENNQCPQHVPLFLFVFGGLKETEDNIQTITTRILDPSRSCIFKSHWKWLLFKLNF